MISSPGRTPCKKIRFLYLFLMSVSDSPQQSGTVVQVGSGWFIMCEANSSDRFVANILSMLEMCVCPVFEGWPLCVNEKAQNTPFSHTGTAKPPPTQKRCLRRFLAGIILRVGYLKLAVSCVLQDDASMLATNKRLLYTRTLNFVKRFGLV